MTPEDERIDQLLEKLETLIQRQSSFSQEINELSEEIYRLKYSQTEQPGDAEQDGETSQPVTFTETEAKPVPEEEPVTSIYEPIRERTFVEPPRYSAPVPDDVPEVKSNMEKYIGENLINKIGIIITVLGVAIGAKYTIEHQLISPLTRIILGFFMGLGFLGVGI